MEYVFEETVLRGNQLYKYEYLFKVKTNTKRVFYFYAGYRKLLSYEDLLDEIPSLIELVAENYIEEDEEISTIWLVDVFKEVKGLKTSVRVRDSYNEIIFET